VKGHFIQNRVVVNSCFFSVGNVKASLSECLTIEFHHTYFRKMNPIDKLVGSFEKIHCFNNMCTFVPTYLQIIYRNAPHKTAVQEIGHFLRLIFGPNILVALICTHMKTTITRLALVYL
jgi:hypothetical protein